jgi:hypothetical protein
MKLPKPINMRHNYSHTNYHHHPKQEKGKTKTPIYGYVKKLTFLASEEDEDFRVINKMHQRDNTPNTGRET